MAVPTDDAILRVAPALTYSSHGQSATLRSGGRVLRYDGGATRVLALLLPLLDGQRRLDEVIDKIGGAVRPAVLSLCSRLVSDGMVVDDASPRTNTAGELLDRVLRSPTAGTVDRRPISTVRVVGQPDEVAAIARVAPDHWSVEGAVMDDLLETAGVEDVCTIVWLADPNDVPLADWNAGAYHNRHPWLPISHFDGEVAVVGPFVYPRETPCFECYRRRRAARSRLGERYLEMRPLEPTPLTSKALTTVLGGIAVALLHDWSARSNPYIPGAVRTVTFDEGLQVSTEYVLRVPRCPGCRPTANVARPTLWSEEFPPRERA
jgi:bacteriocin biosynthesis cyclodehydratase domain-containing protein